jgi:hypothetical protein
MTSPTIFSGPVQVTSPPLSEQFKELEYTLVTSPLAEALPQPVREF